MKISVPNQSMEQQMKKSKIKVKYCERKEQQLYIEH